MTPALISMQTSKLAHIAPLFKCIQPTTNYWIFYILDGPESSPIVVLMESSESNQEDYANNYYCPPYEDDPNPTSPVCASYIFITRV